MKIKEEKIKLLKEQVLEDFKKTMNVDFSGEDSKPRELCKSDDWFLLGRKYYKEFSVDGEPYKLETARRCFTLAAVGGHAQYKKLLADGYLNGVFSSGENATSEGLFWLKRAAEDENSEAQAMLGLRYFYAQGFKRDLKTAFSWFLKAADHGNPLAARYVGEYYDQNGWSGVVEPDAKIACEWYKKAADLGDAGAQCLYGKELYLGKTIPRDYDKAFELFSKSAEQNDPNGIFMQAQCVWFGLGTEKDKSRAFELFKKAADLGSPQGALDAGKALYLGEGTERDLERALVYFELSAEGGMAEGKNAAEICRKEIGL